MDLARSLKVCGGAEGSGQVWAEGVVYATGGGTVWRDDGDTFLYQRLETPTATPVIEERHIPTGAVRRVTDGANHLVAGGGVWAVRRKSGYEDSHGHHETGWFPPAVDDLTGLIAIVTDYQSGVGLALWDGASVVPVALAPVDGLEACFRNGVLVYRSEGRLYVTAVGGVQHVQYGPTLPHVSGVQHDGHGHLIGWHEAHGLVVYTAGDDRGLVLSADGRDHSGRIRPQADGTLLVVSSAGQGERLHELRRYVVDLAASTVNGAPHAVVDLRQAPGAPAPPVPPSVPATVTITSYAPATGAAPLKVRAVASFTGPVVSLRWRSRIVGASTWVTAATNPASDLDHTFTFPTGEHEIGVDALDGYGRILDATGASRRVTATDATPAPVRELLSTLQPGDRLERGESLVTRRHQVSLDFDGRLALTRRSDGSVLWSVSGPSDVLVMQADGNLVLYLGALAVWSSQTEAHPQAFAILQDDGNFVVYDAIDTNDWALWSTGTVDPEVAPPPPVHGAAPSLRIVGKDWRDGDTLYVPRWVSGLTLPVKSDADRDRFLDWAVATGFNGVRVFAGALTWTTPVQTPESARAALTGLIAATKARGIALEITAVTDSGTGYDWREHLRAVMALCASHAHVIVEGGNELGHPSQDWALSPSNVGAVMSGYVRPWAVGAPLSPDEPEPDGSWPAGQGAYSTVHLDRGRDQWNMARRVREIYAVSEVTGKPALNNEPIGAAEETIPGRRSNDPAIFATFGALDAAFRGVGGVHHSQSGLMATVPGPREQACADAYVAAHQAVRSVLGGDVGQYLNVSHQGSPLAAKDDARVVRIYSFVTGNRGVAVYIGAVDGPVGEQWANGWRSVRDVVTSRGADGRSLRVVEVAR